MPGQATQGPPTAQLLRNLFDAFGPDLTHAQANKHLEEEGRSVSQSFFSSTRSAWVRKHETSKVDKGAPVGGYDLPETFSGSKRNAPLPEPKDAPLPKTNKIVRAPIPTGTNGHGGNGEGDRATTDRPAGRRGPNTPNKVPSSPTPLSLPSGMTVVAAPAPAAVPGELTGWLRDLFAFVVGVEQAGGPDEVRRKLDALDQVKAAFVKGE